MRPLRLLVALSTSLIAVTLLFYAALGPPHDQQEAEQATGSQGHIKALFSFTSPTSLFPPSAIISLTDDNSTFFLARPAAFGPLLPKNGLSGPLWIGSGFGDDTLGWTGELGCGDDPGWDQGSQSLLASSHSPAQAGSHATKSTPREEVSGRGHADIQSIQESAEIAGKVVLLKRGGCGFLAKVQWAQRRGGVAVIVGDDVRGGALVRMYAKGDTSNITIPSLFTSHTTAHLLSSLLPPQRNVHNAALSNTAYTKPSNPHHDLGHGSGDQAQGGRWRRPTSTKPKSQATLASSHTLSETVGSTAKASQSKSEADGLFRSLLSALGLHNGQGKLPKAGSRRIPGSGDLDWINPTDWDNDEDPIKTGTAIPMATAPRISDGFVIGKQDWRDPDLLSSPAAADASASVVQSAASPLQTSANVFPGSGEYRRVDRKKNKPSWWRRLSSPNQPTQPDESSARAEVRSVTSISGADLELDTTSSRTALLHEGLWVTLTPTNVSTSPFFDTLLVLVVSPLVTLTVVYALLLLRSRIRRRRWRAPKSVVERLPVRTYQTISEPSASPTPEASSPTTPLLQRSPEQPPLRSHSSSELPGTSSAIQHGSPDRAEEKRETGLAAWRRRYGGRQKECVVCLEEYEDGVSQVMSLPCGHEFHANCITPWLVTRRRTCPICKGDVVRSLSQSYHDRLQPSSTQSPESFNDLDDLQAQAIRTRNDSPSASRPVPISTSALGMYAPVHDDVETGWTRSGTSREPQDVPANPYRELSSTVSTVIWRGLDAVRASTGLQRRQPPDDVDRDR
ncbi:hypothetical protein IAQ61_009383 [Plenodomus lingam]|uniref:RING-type E3 ubiquitin transferase n=1 Tax=Leptosphaeria maculans (strain JN3 / isolate v23.1.3 / race Av1-4-5-6-7-8) TaxID=985895 RepID=E4ZTZ1_LEPMJ|nr:similar to PA and RING finger domain-containing protein [Plenodomus lingam JN3]KAH9863106.1 hypothetical protein IAQ61_009383 [Plenodomus lingam]CBX94701.1 similar to PA and RING finger domain-containing protein [Plenodomus lingam JN3]